MAQALIAELNGISMTSALAATLERTAEYAVAQGHRQVTLEHLLLALTEDVDAQAVFAAANVDLGRLRNDVAQYLGQLGDSAPPGESGTPVASAELKRIIEYAAAAAQQGRRPHVDGAIVLAAMIGEGKSMAASFIKAQGLTFETAVRVLQQTRSQTGAAPPAPSNGPTHNGASPKSAEDILATARVRIQASRGRVAEPSANPNPQRRPAPAGGSHGPSVGEPGADKGADNRDELPGPASRPMGVGSGGPPRSGPSEGLSRDWKPPALPSARNETIDRTPQPPITRAREKHADPDDDQPPPLPGWMVTQAQAEAAAEEGKGNAQNDTGAAVRPLPRPQNDGAVNRPAAVARDALTRPAAEIARDLLRPTSTPAVEQGQLVENIPRSMCVGVPETVEVRIAREHASRVATGLQGRGAPVRHALYITKAMSVRLRAPDGGFRIETASPETQWTDATMSPLSGEFAVWQFLVTPERRGDNSLQLVVAARVVGADGVTADTTMPERVITVQVRTNYVRNATRWSGWVAALVAGGAIGRLGEDALTFLLGILNRLVGS